MKSQKGFTVIEVIICIALITLAVVLLSDSITKSYQQNLSIERSTTEQTLLQNTVSYIKSQAQNIIQPLIGTVSPVPAVLVKCYDSRGADLNNTLNSIDYTPDAALVNQPDPPQHSKLCPINTAYEVRLTFTPDNGYINAQVINFYESPVRKSRIMTRARVTHW